MRALQILFVEDDALIGASTCEFMRGRGVRVLDADSAATAMIVVERRGYLSGLVTDIDLGAGEDGFDIARRARDVYPSLPVIYVSGSAAARHRAEGVEGSVFIDKPCHPRQILDALLGLSFTVDRPALSAADKMDKTPDYGDRLPPILCG